MPAERAKARAGAAVLRAAALSLVQGALWLAAGAGPAAAQPRADQLAACAACHGPGGNAAIAEYPSIAGQPRLFIENQLVLIREGLRDVPSMKAVMGPITDAEIVELSKYYAAQTPTRRPGAADPARMKAGAELSRRLLCGSCHLPDYAGQNQVPRLAWQNEAFLVASMKQFRDHPGLGRDTIMAATLRGLSDTDLSTLAHYLAHHGR